RSDDLRARLLGRRTGIHAGDPGVQAEERADVPDVERGAGGGPGSRLREASLIRAGKAVSTARTSGTPPPAQLHEDLIDEDSYPESPGGRHRAVRLPSGHPSSTAFVASARDSSRRASGEGRP